MFWLQWLEIPFSNSSLNVTPHHSDWPKLCLLGAAKPFKSTLGLKRKTEGPGGLEQRKGRDMAMEKPNEYSKPTSHSGIWSNWHTFKKILLNENKITALTMWSCIIIFSEGTTRPVTDIWHPKCRPQVSSSKRASLFLLIELSFKSLKGLLSKEF